MSEYVNLSLSTESINTLLALLQPSSDDEDEGNELYDAMRAVLNVPIAKQMVFINEYEMQCVYGGPEEGGWYYTTRECVCSFGYDNLDRAIDEFMSMVDDAKFTDDDGDPIVASLDGKIMKEGILSRPFPEYELSEVDRNGNGTALTIEPAPGWTHDVERRFFN